ncbi:hypothetical protein C2U71_24245 [Burkholderia ubonensis]|nr:hypothetical protein C2U71_24245 [Burkholderia ubonensis]
MEADHLKPMFWYINPFEECASGLEQESVTLDDSDYVGTYVIFRDKSGAALLQVNLGALQGCRTRL